LRTKGVEKRHLMKRNEKSCEEILMRQKPKRPNEKVLKRV